MFIGRQRNAWEPTGWVGTECMVMFIGRAWTEQEIETRPVVPQNGGNGPPTVETGVLLIGRGLAYHKTDETNLCWSATVETGVLFIRRGVAYRKTEETDLCWSATI